MKKNPIQDIIPPKSSRSIRKIPIPTRPENRSEREHLEHVYKLDSSPEDISESEEVTYIREESTDEEVDNNGGGRRYGIWIIAIVAVIIVGFIIGMSFFVSAKVVVTPVSKDTILSSMPFVAKKTASEGELGYETAAVVKEIRKEIPATIEQKSEQKASGTIVIYNETAQPQQLIKNTRFTDPKGLIFRIQAAVTVPAASKDAAKKAGQVEARVVADAAGDKYNIGMSDFTIPGFKGDSKFTTVYARSKTTMTGGTSGIQKIATAQDIADTRAQLKQELQNDLLQELNARKPQQYILFASTTAISYEDVAPIPASSSTVFVIERGTISGVMFDKNKFGSAVAKASGISNITGPSVAVSNIDELQFNLTGLKGPFQPLSGADVTFTLSGNAHLVSNIDTKKVAESLAGKKASDMAKIITQQFKNISTATNAFSPIWIRTFPEDVGSIKVIISTE
ncbi:MAG: hypothetical protein WC757_02735 [Candidatus Paceibacterota bacterium]|jgi:hypothetical protein